MCTLTWLHTGSAYQIFFNRDELNTRQRAVPPQLSECGGIRYIAPTDTDAGGTWITANELGTSLCLLNNYAAADKLVRENWISRGQLVKSLASLDGDAVIAALQSTSLERYRAFDLVAFEIGRKPIHCSWADNRLKISTPIQPLSSSSFDTDRVIRGRVSHFKTRFPNKEADAAALLEFHQSHAPSKSAYSVCMHRPDAQTVSYAQISVNQQTVTFDYVDGPPCSASEVITTCLQRSSSESEAALSVG